MRKLRRKVRKARHSHMGSNRPEADFSFLSSRGRDGFAPAGHSWAQGSVSDWRMVVEAVGVEDSSLEDSYSSFSRKMSQKPPVTYPPRAPKGTLERKANMAPGPVSGLWSASRPILFQVTLVTALLATVLGDCGPPPYLTFASPMMELNETSYKVGTAVRYTCRPGYSRTSSKTQNVVCRPGGTWHYPVFCVKKQCSNPGELRNGQVIVNSGYSFGSRIDFSCLEGYILVGPTSSYCDILDKTVAWSDSFPECVIAQCEPPPDIQNGRHTGDHEDTYTYGSSVTYSCDPSFSMVGEPSISCTVENKTVGVWSPSPPACKKIYCHQPGIKDGKIISGFGPTYMYKDTIAFACNQGYALKGSSVIRCAANSTWDPPPPVCELNGCTGLPDIPHVLWEARGYRRPTKEEVYGVDTVLKYHCLPGYKPADNKPTTVTCLRNFRWGPHTECEEICCPTPDLKNGKIIQQRKSGLARGCTYFYGDTILYSCAKGPRSTASCQKDGTWNPETPTCDPSCNNPPAITHGHYQDKSSFMSYKFKYECDKGYILDGEDTLTCHSSYWSSEAPQCKALCLKPEVEHAVLSVEKHQYIESENVTIHCDSGYRVVGSQNITCSEDRTWYPKVPTCEWVVPAGCDHVLKGREIMQCLSRAEDVKMSLELYKLSLEIELLELERDKQRTSALKPPQ